MKKPTIHKKLSVKEILKRHKSNPQDKDLHKIIESEGSADIEEKFNSVVKTSTKQEPFDKKLPNKTR